MGEHRQRSAYQIHTTHQFVGTSVGINTEHLHGSDIKRVDAVSLASESKSACHCLEEVAIVLALLFHLGNEHLAELCVGIGF